MNNPFLSKQCKPCEGGINPLTREEYSPLLSWVPGWGVVEDKKIEKKFKFKNFKEALKFVNQVGDLAEKESHHPNILLYGWNRVKITLWTHAIGGLSENDIILAVKIDELIRSSNSSKS